MISESNIRMLQMLTEVLHERAPNPIPPENWQAIYDEMTAQTVFALPAPYLDSLPCNSEQRRSYVAACGQNVQKFYKVMEAQKAVLAVLEAAQIPAVVLKGAAAAANYPHPEYRCMGDIDLLVMPDDFPRAYDALVHAGYETEGNLKNFHRHIGFHSPDGTEIELHHAFASGPDKKQNSFLDALLYQGIPNRVWIVVNGYQVPILPPSENGLVLLYHIYHHISSGLGLRQIIDWMVFLKNNPQPAVWDSILCAAEQIGLKTLAEATTAACRKYLGLECIIHGCCEPICDELMEYVLGHGNFGKKDAPIQYKTVHLLRLFRNPVHALFMAQQYGRQRWPACKKHPWLVPFAWLYQLCRWVRLGIMHGVNFSYIKKTASEKQEETGFLLRLGIRRFM